VNVLLGERIRGCWRCFDDRSKRREAGTRQVALATGNVKAETLTPALVVATDDKDKAEIVELLKKAGAVPPPAVDAAMLQSYVGKYKDEAGLEVVITLADGRLSAVPTGQRHSS